VFHVKQAVLRESPPAVDILAIASKKPIRGASASIVAAIMSI